MNGETQVGNQNNRPLESTNSRLVDIVSHCIKALDLFFIPSSFGRNEDWSRIRSLGSYHFYAQVRIIVAFESIRMAVYSIYIYNNYPHLMNQIYNTVK